ncbi:MAG: class III extradiol ring-cleavage dioxygenase [Thermodesulfobacteriota bacterium]|nr:class III extradiol ring-cleavage dioxygenase [Thermodesulfobacteriota bacterium]
MNEALHHGWYVVELAFFFRGMGRQMTPLVPVLFISHGPPTILLMDTPAGEFLKQLGGQIPPPDAILCISAHWEAVKPTVSAGVRSGIIHDFSGPPQLFDQAYPAPGSPGLADKAVALLAAAGINAEQNPERGLDHGAWVPLKLMFPAADIPVVQLAIQTEKDPSHHFELGKALRPLRENGILIIGSGGAVHNLYEIQGHKINDEPVAYAAAFDKWLREKLTTGQTDQLIDYQQFAPEPGQSHPFPAEHFLPLFVSLGAGLPGEKAIRIHQGFMYGTLSMAAYQWSGKQA